MSEGWVETTLADVAVIAPAGTFNPKSEVNDAPYVGLEHLEPDQRSIAAYASSDATTSSKTRFQPRDVLFGKLRPYLRKVAQADRAGVCSTEIIVLRPRDARITPDFLYYTCASPALIAYAVNHSAGTRMPRIKPELLMQARIQLPPPQEQQRIVNVLAAVDNLIADLATQIEAATSMRDAYLAAVFRRGELVALNTYALLSNGTTFPKRFQGQEAGDHPFFKVSDGNLPGNERSLIYATNWVSDRVREKLGARIWPKGTVAFPRVGGALAGEKRRQLQGPSLVDDNQMVAVPLEGVDADFLFACLLHVRLQPLAQGGVVPSVNQEIVGRVLVPLAAPAEQEEIGKTSAILDEDILNARQLRNETRRLRTALLMRLLSGERALPRSEERLVPSNLVSVNGDPLGV